MCTINDTTQPTILYNLVIPHIRYDGYTTENQERTHAMTESKRNVKAMSYRVTKQPQDKYDITEHETRWRLVDMDTGEIVDDAQGYGYKSAQNAYRAWGYKSMPKSKRDAIKSTKRRVQLWWKHHHGLSEDLMQIQLDGMKNGEDWTQIDKDCREHIKTHATDIPDDLTVNDILRYY